MFLFFNRFHTIAEILVDMLREEKRRSAQAEAKLERVSNDRKQFGGRSVSGTNG